MDRVIEGYNRANSGGVPDEVRLAGNV